MIDGRMKESLAQKRPRKPFRKAPIINGLRKGGPKSKSGPNMVFQFGPAVTAHKITVYALTGPKFSKISREVENFLFFASDRPSFCQDFLDFLNRPTRDKTGGFSPVGPKSSNLTGVILEFSSGQIKRFFIALPYGNRRTLAQLIRNCLSGGLLRLGRFWAAFFASAQRKFLFAVKPYKYNI